MKPVIVKSSMYIDVGIKINEKDPRLNIDDHERMSKYKNIFAEGCSKLVRRSFCY